MFYPSVSNSPVGLGVLKIDFGFDLGLRGKKLVFKIMHE